MEIDTRVIDRLLSGDAAIRYQVYRDLLGEDRPSLQRRITTEGWGRQFLEQRQPSRWNTLMTLRVLMHYGN